MPTSPDNFRIEPNQRLQQLRRSFDDDIRCAPATDTDVVEEFLLLELAGEMYAYSVAHAQAILPVPTIIPVPNLPPAVLGIINFRGQILSVTTIHGLLGLPESEAGPGSRVIVTKDLPLLIGILADSVQKIAEIAVHNVQPLPETIDDSKARLLAGQIYLDNQIVFLLDMKQLCVSESLAIGRNQIGD